MSGYLSGKGAWETLKANLYSQYGAEEGLRRYEALQDGSEPDLRRWRGIGGAVHTPRTCQPLPARVRKEGPRQKPGPSPERFAALLDRNRKMLDLYHVGVEPVHLAERFGLDLGAVYAILRGMGVNLPYRRRT